jgi:hypothetical protein
MDRESSSIRGSSGPGLTIYILDAVTYLYLEKDNTPQTSTVHLYGTQTNCVYNDILITFEMVHLPPELWQAVFEQMYTYDVHFFDQSSHDRWTVIRKLEPLQLVCRNWRVSVH